LREPLHDALSMLVNPANDVIRDTDVERASRFVREDINPVICHDGKASWIAGSSPAMTMTEKPSRSTPLFTPAYADHNAGQ
jgi:hypothetical protein